MKIDLLETPSEDIRIEIIPLIDVIFCILTFFILAAVGLTRQQAIDLDLPNASTGEPLASEGLAGTALRQERLYIGVDAIGQIYVDQQPVPFDWLYDVLQQHQQLHPEGLVVLYASRDARYEAVIQILDLLRSFGGDRVALATLPGESPDTQQSPEDENLLDLSPFPPDADPSLNILENPGEFESLPNDPVDSPDNTELPDD